MYLEIAEADYCYGVGTLRLRVVHCTADLLQLPELEWVRIVGREIRWDGSEADRDREVVVRVSALPAAVRPGHGRASP